MASKGPAKARHVLNAMAKIFLGMVVGIVLGLVYWGPVVLLLAGLVSIVKAIIAPPSLRQGDLWRGAGLLVAWAVVMMAYRADIKRRTGSYPPLFPGFPSRGAHGRKDSDRHGGATY